MKRTAFSLIEISVVLIVIGILAAGIVGANSLIKSSRLATARSLTTSSTVPSIEGLVAWYETSLTDSLKSSESFNGSQISTWYDNNPASIVLRKNTLSRSASSSVTYQQDGINNIPSLKFDGSGNLTLSNFYQGTLASATLFFVIQPTAIDTTTAKILSDSSSSGSVAAVGIKSASIHLNFGSAANTATGSNSANVVTDQNYIVVAYAIQSASKAYLNNSKDMAGNSVINAGSNSLKGLTVGTDRNGSYQFSGLISEIIIYNRPLKDSERKDVLRYLSNKYKIAVSGF